MGKSEKAVYDFVRLVNNGNGMGSSIKLNSKNVTIFNDKQIKVTFSSDIVIETKYNTGALVVTIMDNKIITYTERAMFWTQYCNFNLNDNSLIITNGNNMIDIS
ncbi:hypothetical protein [Treponema sp. R80B11-R83G3]